MNLQKSNDILINFIIRKKPFIVMRFGIGPETLLSYRYYQQGLKSLISYKDMNTILTNCGIYCINNEQNNFSVYFDNVNKCIKNSDVLASFGGQLETIEDRYSKDYDIMRLDFKVLEPFYILDEDIQPWTHSLVDKKVLIIHPFVDSFQKQLKNNFHIFEDESKKIFLDSQEFVFYKAYQTHAFNHLHQNWLETFEIMCNDIKEIDFDIALLGCGGYGLPLCNYIKTELNKSAIYIGGGLQLLFGVMGSRWENFDYWKKVISENNTQFIKPSGNEIIQNKNIIEKGCYW